MRNTVISLYQPSHLASLIPTMQSYIESVTIHHLSKARDNEDITFSDLSLKMATDVIGKAAFGVNFGLLEEGKTDINKHEKNSERSIKEDEVSEFVKLHVYSTTSLKMDLTGSLSIILGLLAPILQEPFRQVLKRIPWTADRNIDQTNQKLAKKIDEIVAKKAKEDKNSKDFISAILKAKESDGAVRDLFTPDYICSLAYEHLLAGSATTSFTLSSLIYLVSKHPEVEKKLLKEIDEFGPRYLIPNADDLQQKFPYLDQVNPNYIENIS